MQVHSRSCFQSWANAAARAASPISFFFTQFNACASEGCSRNLTPHAISGVVALSIFAIACVIRTKKNKAPSSKPPQNFVPQPPPPTQPAAFFPFQSEQHKSIQKGVRNTEVQEQTKEDAAKEKPLQAGQPSDHLLFTVLELNDSLKAYQENLARILDPLSDIVQHLIPEQKKDIAAGFEKLRQFFKNSLKPENKGIIFHSTLHIFLRSLIYKKGRALRKIAQKNAANEKTLHSLIEELISGHPYLSETELEVAVSTLLRSLFNPMTFSLSENKAIASCLKTIINKDQWFSDFKFVSNLDIKDIFGNISSYPLKIRLEPAEEYFLSIIETRFLDLKMHQDSHSIDLFLPILLNHFLDHSFLAFKDILDFLSAYHRAGSLKKNKLGKAVHWLFRPAKPIFRTLVPQGSLRTIFDYLYIALIKLVKKLFIETAKQGEATPFQIEFFKTVDELKETIPETGSVEEFVELLLKFKK